MNSVNLVRFGGCCEASPAATVAAFVHRGPAAAAVWLRLVLGGRRHHPPALPASQAVVCSVYYSFCGNAPADGMGPGGSLKEAVCLKWLHPVSASSHSAFTRWVVYGEASVAANASAAAAAANASSVAAAAAAAAALNGLAISSNRSSGTLQVDYPLDGKVSLMC